MAKSKKSDEFEAFVELDDFDLEDDVVDAEDIEEEEPEVDEEEEEVQTEADESQPETLPETVADSDHVHVEEDIVGDKSKKAKWYVVHTYSGHENKVKVNIEKIVENRGMQDLVLSIVVPTEDHVEIKNGQRKVKTRKMFPGYVIVKMIVTNESWYLVRNTQGVTGFVGHGSEPIPLTNEEVRRMGIEKVYIQMDIEPGDSVKVINGPFESFM
ncbi:MAG TPA: transcription termination/antitermination protein NusG, partial [Anaerovoracaceae bacterium]|nr:transcription termination/antitermination protein NusG [Anaerovoracaceae bacterium]